MTAIEILSQTKIHQKMNKQKAQDSSRETNETRQAEKLIQQKIDQTEALKKLLKALEADSSSTKKN